MWIIFRKAIPEDAYDYAVCHIVCWRAAYKGIISGEYPNNMPVEPVMERRKKSILISLWSKCDISAHFKVYSKRDYKQTTMMSALSDRDVIEYGKMVSILSKRMISNSAIAEEAAQEVWVEVLRSLPSGTTRFMFRIATDFPYVTVRLLTSRMLLKTKHPQNKSL